MSGGKCPKRCRMSFDRSDGLLALRRDWCEPGTMPDLAGLKMIVRPGHHGQHRLVESKRFSRCAHKSVTDSKCVGTDLPFV